MKKSWLFCLFLLVPHTALAQSRVVATIKPLHALVAGVMHGDGDPELLLDGSASPHDAVLRPSQVDAMADADVVFYMDEDMEVFMREAIDSIPMQVKLISMMRTPGLQILPTRRGGIWASEASETANGQLQPQKYSGFSNLDTSQVASSTQALAQQWQQAQRSRQADISSRTNRWSGGGAGGGIGGVGNSYQTNAAAAQRAASQAYQKWDNEQAGMTYEQVQEYLQPEQPHDEYTGYEEEKLAHADLGDDHDGHRHGREDLHVWLNPENAKKMVDVISQVLSELYPGKSAIYQQNARAMKSRIDMQTDRIRQRLSFVRGNKFVVFHDAYQYFENAYGLQSAGSVLVRPDRMPGARHLSRLRDAMERAGVVCVFSEPQFDSRLIDSLTEGMNVRVGVLDPMGTNLPAGEDMYFELNDQLTQSFENCVGF